VGTPFAAAGSDPGTAWCTRARWPSGVGVSPDLRPPQHALYESYLRRRRRR